MYLAPVASLVHAGVPPDPDHVGTIEPASSADARAMPISPMEAVVNESLPVGGRALELWMPPYLSNVPLAPFPPKPETSVTLTAETPPSCLKGVCVVGSLAPAIFQAIISSR